MWPDIGRTGADSVAVSTSTVHPGDPGSIPSHGQHGIFGVTTWLTLTKTGDCLSLVNPRITLMLVPSQFGT